MVVDAASRAVPSIHVRRQISARRISRRSRSSPSGPAEDYVGTSLSSPRVLSSPTRSRIRRSLSLSLSLDRPLLAHLGLPAFLPPHPRHELSAALVSRLLHSQHVCRTAFSTCPRSLLTISSPLLLSTLLSFSRSRWGLLI